MKILVIISTFTHMGGAERQALYLVQYLAGLKSCEVEVLTFQDGHALRIPLRSLGVRVHVVPYYPLWSRAKRMRALAQMTSLLRMKVKPDALLPFGTPASKVAGLVWRYSGARFCWWNQQDEGRELNGTEVEGRVLRGMTCITSNSVAGQIFLNSTYGLSSDSVMVYNNGTPLHDVTSVQSDWKQRLKLEHRTIVTMVANVTRYKDHDTLLEAWVMVREHFQDAVERPVLVLAGYLNETATVTALKLKAFDAGISSDDVLFIGAISDVRGLLSESDVVVHSSLTEGCPNSVCEAMAMGRAVVATDIPGCRQALGEDASEWLAAPRDPGALAARIIELLEDGKLRRRLGSENRTRIEKEFSIPGMNEFFRRQIESGMKCRLA